MDKEKILQGVRLLLEGIGMISKGWDYKEHLNGLPVCVKRFLWYRY